MFKKKPKPIFDERRQHKRIAKQFILHYYFHDKPNKKVEITQLKNISIGGMCFISSKAIEPNKEIKIDLKTPYLANKAYFNAIVLNSHERVANILYETRVKFEHLDTKTEILVKQMMEVFLKDPKDILGDEG
ncbi:MAG: PilZ domain-containing protein [Candidatus Omnitrophica bacterium]|nr:PilZ domain-containing protein [Candidatus Omnitrophota bacterium]